MSSPSLKGARSYSQYVDHVGKKLGLLGIFHCVFCLSASICTRIARSRILLGGLRNAGCDSSTFFVPSLPTIYRSSISKDIVDIPGTDDTAPNERTQTSRSLVLRRDVDLLLSFLDRRLVGPCFTRSR